MKITINVRKLERAMFALGITTLAITPFMFILPGIIDRWQILTASITAVLLYLYDELFRD